ncbi:ankyrin repeat domain-containing protein SOWAHB isoform X4 [Colletes gigas]|uniref:ankyrin repeat domain-containing protein SOWAHB isoform X4 n=1 Tax=Colletes gigas TaxID=935657 RepID=UPI001C9B4BD2|nr:ankyrin repeat domain-containing protein SOWAHB isoform X4 [Colletes gigas]
MATPSELSLEEIRKYLLENGGTARNHDVVKYFKKFLTDPETRVEARNRFKEYVNTLATIKNEEGEKYLVLKKKYRQTPLELSSQEQMGSPIATPDIATPVSPLRAPPPYRPPPPAPLSPTASNASTVCEESCSNFARDGAAIDAQKNDVDHVETGFSTSSPPVPPRRKSQDKIKIENKENVDRNRGGSEAVIKEDEAVAANPGSTEQLSFRERMQRFNRMASETDLQGRPNGTITPTKKRSDKGADEDDSASVASQLDGKSREWLVRAAQGDYQALAKLAAEEPKLARLKDPTSGVSMIRVSTIVIARFSNGVAYETRHRKRRFPGVHGSVHGFALGREARRREHREADSGHLQGLHQERQRDHERGIHAAAHRDAIRPREYLQSSSPGIRSQPGDTRLQRKEGQAILGLPGGRRQSGHLPQDYCCRYAQK